MYVESFLVWKFQVCNKNVFGFRKNNATVKANYTYADKNDDFEREPFIVQFHISSAGDNRI